MVNATRPSSKRGPATAAGAVVAALLALAAPACGGSGGKGGAAGASGSGGTGGVAAGGGAGGGAGEPADGGAGTGAADAKPDQATDFGAPQPDVAVHCPTAVGALPAEDAALVIDDFEGTGKLDGRQRSTSAFGVREQFDATAGATFDPPPAIEAACGAAAPGAAHFRGRAADTGATFAVVFSTPVAGQKALDHYDASATKGVSFRIALGDPAASKLVTLQVNLAGSKWDYTKDVAVTGTTWQTVTVMWSDLTAAPAAPAFSAAALNQLVLPFSPDVDVDLYVDDLAFVR
jgi:hypothetical protein